MSVQIIGAQALRLRKAEEDALNLLLLRKAGSFEGMPLYKLSWAADDNRGLRKKHDVSCPKTDPYDLSCQCPAEMGVALPICFHPTQASYHLLAWRPPQASDYAFSSQTGDDLSKGIYECTGLHFVDPETDAPLNPTSAIIELILPILEEFATQAKAAMHGVNAVRDRERLKRANARKEKEVAKERQLDQRADDLLQDAMPAFKGYAHSAVTGPKTASDSERHASDITKP